MWLSAQKGGGLPAHAVVHGQVRSNPPTVFSVDPDVEIPQIEGCGGALREIGGSTNHHVGQVIPGFLAVEGKERVATIIGLRDGQVIPVVVDPEFGRVRAFHFREVILELVRFSVLNAHHNILSRPEVVVSKPGPILIGGAFQLVDAPLVGWSKAEGLEGWAFGPWFTVNVGVAHVAGGKLVHGGAAEVRGNAKREQLRLPYGRDRKTGERAATKRSIGRLVHPGIVMPVAGDHANLGVGVDTSAPLVIL